MNINPQIQIDSNQTKTARENSTWEMRIPVKLFLSLSSMDVSPTSKLLYLLLKSYTNDKRNFCYPSRKSMAAELNVSAPTIHRCLEELVAAGLVIIMREIEGRRVSFKYVLCDPNSDSKNGIAKDKKTSTDSKNGIEGGQIELTDSENKISHSENESIIITREVKQIKENKETNTTTKLDRESNGGEVVNIPNRDVAIFKNLFSSEKTLVKVQECYRKHSAVINPEEFFQVLKEAKETVSESEIDAALFDFLSSPSEEGLNYFKNSLERYRNDFADLFASESGDWTPSERVVNEEIKYRIGIMKRGMNDDRFDARLFINQRKSMIHLDEAMARGHPQWGEYCELYKENQRRRAGIKAYETNCQLRKESES
ncbi:MAG: helix-turn-helix domain-containing protein [Candidatus Omnitrophota bacterium]